jgi:Leucine-rich repeat (LRR) protein
MKANIKSMINRNYKVSGAIEKIESITELGNNEYEVNFSSGRILKVDEDEILNDFIPVVNAELSHQQKTMIESTAATFNQMDKLTDILINTIEKVQSDPSYVSQATAINNSVKQVVEINKTKIEAMKLVKDIQS